jgi:hypothetical protein
VRTLVISDLHLGSRLDRDVLRRPAALAALLGALDGIDRLVLLGDVVEMLEGRPRVAMDLAEPVLQELGAAMGPGREIVVVAGNHDHALVRPWLRSRIAAGRPIGLAARVPVASGAALARLTGFLKPARVRVQYPGTWVGPGVWATHGHYLDRHLVPEERRGASLLGVVPADHATAEDYEAASGPSLAALQGLLAMTLPSVVGEPLDVLAGLTRRAAFAALPIAAALPGGARLAPLSAGVLGFQFRRSGLPAMAQVAVRMGPRARHVIFGHLHRGGPVPGDEPAEWKPLGRRELRNTGSWVYEPLLLAGAEPGHVYWPGGAVLVEDGAAPRYLSLLDDVDPAGLR